MPVSEDLTVVAPVGALGPVVGVVRYGLEFRCAAEMPAASAAEYVVERYLDRFCLVLPVDADERQKVLDGFFNTVAEDYESLIDVTRNVENIRRLLRELRLRQRIGPDDLIVDFGCGTGLAAEAARDMTVNLIGVDPSENMRHIARARSLVTISPGELAKSAKGRFAGAFASYVMHLLPHAKGFELLWSRLAPQAVMLANFHKGTGVDPIAKVVERAGGRVEHVAASPDHGIYLALHKSSTK